MKRKLFSILTALALCLCLCPFTAAAEGDTTVSDGAGLLSAVDRANTGETVSVQLDADITNSDQLNLTGGSLTLDLNGHELSGSANGPSGADGLFHVAGGSLTLAGSGNVINNLENPTITMASGSIVIKGDMTISKTAYRKDSIKATGGSLKDLWRHI